MGRETILEKAGRYLVEGRLTVTYVREQPARVSARCRGGDGAVYSLGVDHGVAFCSCPARVTECAHLVALRLVVDVPATS